MEDSSFDYWAKARWEEWTTWIRCLSIHLISFWFIGDCPEFSTVMKINPSPLKKGNWFLKNRSDLSLAKKNQKTSELRRELTFRRNIEVIENVKNMFAKWKARKCRNNFRISPIKSCRICISGRWLPILDNGQEIKNHFVGTKSSLLRERFAFLHGRTSKSFSDLENAFFANNNLDPSLSVTVHNRLCNTRAG